MKILIFGLPGAGKSTLAKTLAEKLNAIWINADQVRTKYDDWDFSTEGRIRQVHRMCHLSHGVEMAGKIAIVDFVCPFNNTRELIEADFTIWMDTIESGRFDDTNKVFEKPKKDAIDLIVTDWDDIDIDYIVKKVKKL